MVSFCRYVVLRVIPGARFLWDAQLVGEGGLLVCLFDRYCFWNR